MADLYWKPCRCEEPGPSCVYYGSWDLGPLAPGDEREDEDQVLPANPPDLPGEAVANLTSMVHLSPPCLLHGLAQRFGAKSIYTLSGTMLLSINPYQEVPGLYGEALGKRYRDRASNQPHLFLTAQQALDALLDRGKDQSILISGESGAGKTVATKCVLLYLAQSSGSPLTSLVLKANPLLELFGNAPTLRNHNSSRFGKYLRVGIDPLKGSLTSLSLTTYLLEKSRLLHHLEGESTFHIFDLLGDQAVFNPLKEASVKLDDLFTAFGLDPAMMSSLLEVFQAFRAFDSERLARALGLDDEQVRDVMRVKRLETREGLIETPLGGEEAKAGWDACAMWLYDRLFEGVVSRINSTLGRYAPETPQTNPTVSLLDIFGFEVFEPSDPRSSSNGFEQLCINFTNERIQTVFNHHIFVLEQAVYAAEGLDWSDVVFPSNLPIVDDLNRLLSMATEECLVPRGSDQALGSKIDRLASRGVVSSIQVSDAQRPYSLFTVSHYAGPVTYSTSDFCAKNRGDLPKRWKALVQESPWCADGSWDSLFGSPLFPVVRAGTGESRSNARLETVLTKFSRSLSTLIQELEKTSLHFIRCLKPNETMTAWKFDAKRIEEQLAYCGVLEAIRIARAGYPVRYPHKEFEMRFSMVDTEDVERLGIKRGHTKVFLKNEASIQLEQRRRLKRDEAATTIQAVRRGTVCRRKFLGLKTRTLSVQEWWRARQTRKYFLALKFSVLTLQALYRYSETRQRVVKVQALYRGQKVRISLTILHVFLAKVTVRWKARRVLSSFVVASCRPWLSSCRAKRRERRKYLLTRASGLYLLWSTVVLLQRWWRQRLVSLHTRTFEEVGTQVELKPESCEAEVQADECWTTILDSSTLAENDRLKAENERLQVENSLLQNEWVLVHESIYEMRQRLDPLLSQLALLREENRELKRIIRRHK